MKEQLITYDTAILANEKGFDLITGSDCWIKTLDGELIHNSERRNTPEHDRTLDYYLAQPSQSLLQKWLREEHNIHIEILLEEDGAYTKFYFRTMKIGEYFNLSYDDLSYDVYEDALETALIKVLEKIKL